MAPIGAARANLLRVPNFVTIPDNGIARWTFDTDDISGSTLADVWNSNDLTLSGVTTGVSGANQTYNTNEAGSFDGTDDRGDASNLGLGDPAESFSLAAWLLVDDATIENSIMGRYDGDDDILYFSYDRPDGGLRFRIGEIGGNEAQVIGSTTLSADTWYHTCAVYDAGNSEVRVYLDGSPDGSGSANPDDFQTTGDFSVGVRSDGNKFLGGDLDDARVYSKALTDAEVSDLYNTGSI